MAHHAIPGITYDGEDAQFARVDLPREMQHHVVQRAVVAIDLLAQMLRPGRLVHGDGACAAAGLVDVHEESAAV